MKSYYKHLKSIYSFGESVEPTRKPVFRASAIFPVVQNENYTSRITFLGYWLLKRQISEVGLLITLRDKTGKILKRDYITINKAKAYSIELNSILQDVHLLNEHNDFIGSIELEVFSSKDMVFPYPAFVLNYYNEKFATSVHTVGRVYNDFEDLNENESVKVPETGFDIYYDSDLEPFIAFTNGPIPNDESIIDFTIINHKSINFKGKINLGKISPYETIFLKFSKYVENLEHMLEGKGGTIKINHNFGGFFPRFLAGNLQHSFPSVSFTHTYYDCSSCDKESDYWNRKDEKYNDSSVLIPLFITDNFYTDLILYPNFAPSVFSLSFDLYDADGFLLKSIPNYMLVNSNEQKLSKINFNQVIQKYDINGKVKSANVIANWNGGKIPTRLKLGLNVGISNSKSKLPCNICFAPKLGDPMIEKKPGAFHWSPLLNVEKSVLSITNSGTLKQYIRDADVILNFYREKDDKSIEEKLKIKPFGQHRIELDSNSHLRDFLQDEVGWVTVRSDNPHVGGWYFDFQSSGSVAADHFF